MERGTTLCPKRLQKGGRKEIGQKKGRKEEDLLKHVKDRSRSCIQDFWLLTSVQNTLFFFFLMPKLSSGSKHQVIHSTKKYPSCHMCRHFWVTTQGKTHHCPPDVHRQKEDIVLSLNCFKNYSKVLQLHERRCLEDGIRESNLGELLELNFQYLSWTDKLEGWCSRWREWQARVSGRGKIGNQAVWRDFYIPCQGVWPIM